MIALPSLDLWRLPGYSLKGLDAGGAVSPAVTLGLCLGPAPRWRSVNGECFSAVPGQPKGERRARDDGLNARITDGLTLAQAIDRQK